MFMLPRWLLMLTTLVAAGPAVAACPALLQHQMPRLQDEKPVDLCQFAGKVVLVVNTASQCGYTPQYKGLGALQRRYGPERLVVLGFPSNDFGGQEPGNNRQVAEFCENQFDVRFPMFAKSVVKAGPQRNPLYQQLAERSGQTPGWNFHKYLVARDGQQVLSFASAVDPQDPALLRAIDRLLAAK
jgi:glutathione peroxidase